MSTGITEPTVETALDHARMTWYRALAAAIRDPHAEGPDLLADPAGWDLLEAGATVLRAAAADDGEPLAPGELPASALDPAPLRAHWADPNRPAQYQRVFGLVVSKECPPYETWYCPQTFSVYRSQQLADIAGFYRAFGVEPSPQHRERADFIGTELEFMAWCIQKELHARATRGGDDATIVTCREAQRSFLRDHLAWWAPAFARALRRVADGTDDVDAPAASALGAFGRLLVAFIAIERAVLGVEPPTALVAPEPDAAESPECEGCAGAGSGPS